MFNPLPAVLAEIEGHRVFPLGPITTIGRDPTCSISIQDNMVSRVHAEVTRGEDGRFRLRDLGSRHGTYVGGKRVKEVLLNTGDEILIAGMRLAFRDRRRRPGDSEVIDLHIDADPGTRAPVVRSRLPVRSASRFPAAGEHAGRQDLERDYQKLRTILELTRLVGVEHDVAALSERILAAAFELLPAERGAVILVDRPGAAPFATIARTRAGDQARIVLSSSLIGEVLSTQDAVLTDDAGIDDRFERSASIRNEGIRSALCVPMLYQGPGREDGAPGEVLGVLYLDTTLQTGAFGTADLELLSCVANQLGLAMKNAILAREAHQARAAERERLEVLVRNLPSGVVLLDQQRRIVLANPQAEALLPLAGPARVGDILEGVGDLTTAVILADREPREVLVGGSARRTLELRATGFTDGGSNITGVVMMRDVTEERARETRARQEERLALLGRLAGGVAHDFNNLLTVIICTADLWCADESAELPDDAREDLLQIREAADRAAALTRQLLAFGRNEKAAARVVDVNTQVAEMTRLLRRTMGDHVAVRESFAEETPRVHIDPTQLEQIVANLVVNARDAMPGGGTIRVETTGITVPHGDRSAAVRGLAPGRYAVLTVADTGCGMTEEVKQRVFEPFFTTKEVGKGTGLGLSTVYGAVQRARGVIELESEPGRGTVFRVLVPAIDGTIAAPAKVATPDGGRETVLVVDDLDAVLHLTRRTLEREGYRVLTASGGEEAVRIARAHAGTIALLLTDVMMPGTCGPTVAEQVQAARPGIKVLYMSGHIDQTLPGGDLIQSGDAFLAKPFTRDDLLGIVRRALDGHETPSSSTSNRSVALGGMTPPAPLAP